MIEVYTKKNKKFATFNTTDIKAALRKLYQLGIIRTIKHLIVIEPMRVSTYWCADCRKRSYMDYPELQAKGIVCAHCNSDRRLYFVGFKFSQEKQVKYTYAV